MPNPLADWAARDDSSRAAAFVFRSPAERPEVFSHGEPQAPGGGLSPHSTPASGVLIEERQGPPARQLRVGASGLLEPAQIADRVDVETR